jgi:hypothetical protein
MNEDKLRHCEGCNDDFYNGHNNLGIQRCWHLDKAKLLIKKEVSIHAIPPWTNEPREVLSCYTRPGFIYVDKDRTT